MGKRISARLIAGVAAAGMGAVVLTTAVPAFTGTSTAATATAMPAAGVYRGGGSYGANQMSGYQSFTKTALPYALDFQANDTLDNLAWPSWMSDAWKSSGKTVVVGGSLALPGDYNRSFQGKTWSWADAASGALDATWKLEGQRLVASNEANAVLRGNHEFNGGWFGWRVNNGEQADFIKAWQRWVTVLRAVPGEHFTFDWNPTAGQQALSDPTSAYPGDAYVDRIALDVYDGYYGPGFAPGGAQPTAAARAAIWNTILNGTQGINYWKNFAIAHGKHMSFPEWGLRNWTESDGLVHGGGDDAQFIKNMSAIFTDPSYHVDYQAFWEDPTNGGRGVYDPDNGRAVPVPQSRSAYLQYISSSSPAAPVATPTSTPTAAPTTAAPTVAPTTPAPTASPSVVPTPTSSPSPSVTPTPSPVITTNPPITSPSTTAPATTAPPTTTPTTPPTTTPTTTPPLGTSAPTAPVTTDSVIGMSPWSDRSWTSKLTGKTITGNMFAYITKSGIKQVSYYLDDPTRSQPAATVDTNAPFDFATSGFWWANPYNSKVLANGSHSLTAVITATNGTVTVSNSTFTVAN